MNEVKDTPTFTLSEAVSYGWTNALNNIVPFLKYMVIAFVLTLLFNYLERNFGGFGGLKGLLGLVENLAVAAIYYKVYILALNIVDGKKDEINKFSLTSGFENFPAYIFTAIVAGLVVFVGFILLIVPGIFWAIKYFFAVWIAVDTKAGVGDALKKSGEMTKNIKGKIFGLMAFSLGACILGAMLFGVGTLVAIPWVLLTIAYVYRKLDKKIAVAQ